MTRPPYRPYNGPWLETWLELGNLNDWINGASDPPFDKRSFSVCVTREELEAAFLHGNWCVGQAWVYGELCFINQHDGGNEYLVIRRDVVFESISADLMVHDGTFGLWLRAVEAASDHQLRTLEYLNQA